MRLVRVKWLDSAQPEARWQWLSDYKTPEVVHCVSVGWLIGKTKTAIALAPNIGDGGEQASGIIRIPRRCITSIKRLGR